MSEFSVQHADGRIEPCHNYATAVYLAGKEQGAKVIRNW